MYLRLATRFSPQSCARSARLRLLKPFNISHPSRLRSKSITMTMPRDGNDSACWKEIPATGDCPGYSVYTGPINTSELDTREYRIVQLPNKLQAVLIHEANADKSAACVHVAAGHLQDPFDVPGLAHFLEHMISKGSTPFPGEADFLSYISSNGGSRNATTAADWQDYWFSINPPQLAGGLARLAAFFHSPLFTSSLTSREMYAVDSENKRNLQNDSRRAFQIEKSLSAPGHPWTKFGTGNVESLTEAAKKKLAAEGVHVVDGEKPDGDGGPVGREVRRRLIEWWEREYCAGRMALAVVGKESIDELTRLVVPLFSPIPNRALDPRPAFKEPIWGDEQKGTVVFVKTVKDFREFELTFHIPQQAALFRTRPASYLTHLIGHEGPGSICAYLKKKGWLINITASTSHNRTRQIFSIEGRLTREGYLRYKDVLLAIFNYISMVRVSALEPYHSDEIAQMSSIAFRFREKSQPHAYAKALGAAMLEPYPPQELLSRGALSREWDEPAVRELLELMKPELGRVFLMAKEHDETIVGKEDSWEKERWYSTEYRVARLDEEFLDKANGPNANAELFLPSPNPFIPENLSVNKIPTATPAKSPEVIKDTESSILWFKKDDQFWVPKAVFRLNVMSPLASVTPRNAVLNRLLVELVNDALSEITYDASLAGLNYSVGGQLTGLYIAFGGYNDKLPVLVNTVIEKLKTFTIDPARLKIMTEKLSQSLENFYLGQPSGLAEYYTSYLLSPVSWTPKERLAEIPYITAADIDQYRKDLLSKIYIQGLLTGNIEAEQGVQILEQVERILSSRPLSPSERPSERSLLLPQGCNFTAVKTHSNPEETNSALTYYCQFGDLADARLRASLKLLVHIMKEPVFSQLRTVEQLGYVVSSAMWSSVGSMGLGFRLQSLKAPPYLEERVDAFITSYQQTLASMPDDDFQAKKDALVLQLLEAPKNLGEETSWFWYYIDQGYNDFLRDDTDAETIRTLQRKDILDAYDTYLMPTSPVRKKLSMHLVSQQLDASAQTISTNVSVIQDEDDIRFKQSLSWSPAAAPISMPKASGGPGTQSRL